MKLIPYDSVKLMSAVTLDQLVQNLDDNIQKIPSFSIFSIQHEKPFEGSFLNNKFKIAPKINYLNSFMPIFHGKLEQDSKGTIVYLKIVPHFFAYVFLIVTVLFGCLLELTDTRIILGSVKIPLPIVLALFSYIWINFSFWYEVQFSLKKLKKIIVNSS